MSLVVSELIRVSRNDGTDVDKVLLGLHTVQICTALVTSVSCFSFPRRPTVSYQGSQVDGQYTVSALWRYTFAWPAGILILANSIDDFNFQHLPSLHLQVRSGYLEDLFGQKNAAKTLISRLILAHWTELAFQFFFSVAMSILGFSPQLAMYGLLTLIEHKEAAPSFNRSAWILVLALGLAILLSSWTESWNFWIVYSRLCLPIRSELSATIFCKAMRRKDIRGVAHMDEKDEDDLSVVDSGDTNAQVDTQTTKDSEDTLQKTRQATVNLIVSGRPKRVKQH